MYLLAIYISSLEKCLLVLWPAFFYEDMGDPVRPPARVTCLWWVSQH